MTDDCNAIEFEGAMTALFRPPPFEPPDQGARDGTRR